MNRQISKLNKEIKKLYSFLIRQMQQENSIQLFQLKKMFRRLENSKIEGSAVTLVISPQKSVVETIKTLADQISRASNIKDKHNRNSVIDALTSTRQRLKSFNKTPENGLIVLCGNILEEGQKTSKKILQSFEPHKKINFSKYSCDSRFQLEEIERQLFGTEPSVGYVIVNGNGALFATLRGNTTKILKTIKVDLPNQHNKGGQSQIRFSRHVEQSRHQYVRKVCEIASQCFLTNNKCNVVGIVLAGSADFKYDLEKSQMFDMRLQSKVIKIVDISQGFQLGLRQAIEKTCQVVKNMKIIKEQKIINEYLYHIGQADGMVTTGVEQTMKYVEAGVIKKIICFEDLDTIRLRIRNCKTEQIETKYVKPNQNIAQMLTDGDDRMQIMQEQTEQTIFVEWLARNYQQYGCEIEFISDSSAAGYQFAQGYGGVGGFLRYKVDLMEEETYFMEDEQDIEFM